MQQLPGDVIREIKRRSSETTCWLLRSTCIRFRTDDQLRPHRRVVTADSHDDMFLMQWLSERGLTWKKVYGDYFIRDTLNLVIVQWIHDKNLLGEKPANNYATKEGGFSLSQWNISRGYQLTINNCAFAVSRGNFTTFRCIRAKHTPDFTYGSKYAAGRRQIYLLQWYLMNDCGWNEYTYSSSLVSGGLLILQWVVIHGCPQTGRRQSKFSSTQQWGDTGLRNDMPIYYI